MAEFFCSLGGKEERVWLMGKWRAMAVKGLEGEGSGKEVVAEREREKEGDNERRKRRRLTIISLGCSSCGEQEDEEGKR